MTHYSLLDDNHSIGVLIHESEATLRASAVRATAVLEGGSEGDGLLVIGSRASALLDRVAIESNERSGLAVFGGSISIVGGST